MEPEEAIKIKHALPRNGDAGAHVVIRLLAMRDHNVQSVSSAALEEHDQALCARSSSLSGIHRACKKTWHHAGANNGQSAILQKNSASDRHGVAPRALALGYWPLALSFWPLALTA